MNIDMLTILLSGIVTIMLILTVAGVILLRPVSQRLGHLLEAMAREKNERRGKDELRRFQELLDAVESRVSLLEERQDFAEALQGERVKTRRLPAGEPEEST